VSIHATIDLKRAAWFVAFTLTAVLLFAPVAAAGMLSADENAYLDWHGSQYYAGSHWGMGGQIYFHANVDYAVYAPGQFEISFPGQDPSGGTRFVYAYQIDFDIPQTTASDESLAYLTVGLDGATQPQEQVAHLGNFSTSGTDVEPVSQNFAGSPPTSAISNFYESPNPSELVPFSQSNLLIFTSPAAPEWYAATLQGVDSSHVKTELLPSPGVSVPEPGTLTLWGLATVGLLMVRLTRRRAKMT